ncbi:MULTISPECIES: EnvZ/OmpR regulon moderator MzrA [unclassified Brenneria]|uniref:EnvZ/OmpR regulon moderator MzrA n=1 Tax=unclassified Brenneria TaxID=2634434 RepID=UPI0029C2D4D2|nr:MULTISPECIES: EnvZ/OmpR regulon moderator MzrA [unclassified Brenneria]MDX5628377.1 EnvZ/OmpR regulon moderator MzrA [Brenneria sp. L3-3Z]MDX5695440.1 EnvZ/OmpR regulon moderator MzrA [Brenneria sp. L4-2C]MEE3662289.1 EnvZ/OmpR regulon moderator MzrA [Brenneria sp. g21c3]
MSTRWFYRKKLWRIVLLAALPLIALMLVAHRPQDEAMLHIQPLYHGAALPDGFYIYQRLNERGIEIKSITPAKDSLIVRLASPAQSVEARDILRLSLPKANITTQQTLAPTPFWQQKLTQKQSKLG